MPIGSEELITSELDTFDEVKLYDELKKAKEELFNLRFQSATGQLESHGRIRAVKRDIARIYTVLRERELGIRAIPEIVAGTATKSDRKRGSKKVDAAEANEVTDTADAVETETKEA